MRPYREHLLAINCLLHKLTGGISCPPWPTGKWSAILQLATVALTFSASAGLVGHWTFDEGSGTTIQDSSGLGNHGILLNPKPNTWTNGHSGTGLYFDGTTGANCTYVSIPDNASLHITNAISFAAWIRCDDIYRDAPILDKEGPGQLSYWFGAFGTANFGLLLSGNGNNWSIQDRNQGNISQGQWMHVASTWDGTTTRHYLNGVLLQETATFNGPLFISDAALVIGANVPFSNTAFKGIIDDARLYDHALNQTEINSLVGTTRELVGYWAFDEGSGTNIFDQSIQGNHGTLINPRTNTWTRGISGSALYFDGTVGLDSTYVAVPDAASLRISTEISFAAWVRCDDIRRDAPIMAKEGDGKLSYWFGAYGLSNEGGGPGCFGVLLDADGSQPWSTYNRNQGAIPEGQWVHLASTWDGVVIRHYLNGRPLSHTGSYFAPTHISDAFLAIGVNSLYNFAANHTAFKGAIDEVRLYNYALSPETIRDLYLSTQFQITAVACEGKDVRLTWECIQGRSYVVQTNTPGVDGGFTTAFADLTPSITIPVDFIGTSMSYSHAGGSTNSQALLYRIKLLP